MAMGTEPATYGARRFAMLACGKACALSVLLMSLSDRLSIAVGFEYMNPFSFAICGVAIVVFLALIRCLDGHRARLAFAVGELVLIVAWCGIVVFLRWFCPEGAVPPPLVMLLFAALGRIATLFVNIQWNFHFSLNDVENSARSVVVSVLLALLLFLVASIAPNEAATAYVVGALLTSGALNLVREMQEGRNPDAPNAVETMARADARSPLSTDSLARTRMLYFGTRVVYGMALGFMVSAVAAAPATVVGPLPLVAMVVLLLGLGVVGAWLFGSGGKGMLYLVATAPVLASCAAVICFYSDDMADLARVFAMLVEVAWTIQNLFQLPSYRRMTGMKTSLFAYYEYAAQVIPFYLVAWLVSSNLESLPVLADPAATGVIGCVCVVALVGFSVSAMVWHIVRYYPVRKLRGGVAHAVSVRGGTSGLAFADVSAATLLTPREREVFSLLAEGYSRPYIAKTLFISVDTVKVHAKHIYAKLGVDSQDALIETAHGGSVA